jgi:putative Holliday junction resolvase
MRPGVRLGIDVGTVRIGVAISDPHGLLATPLQTVDRTDSSWLDILSSLCTEHNIIEILVGLPLSLSGSSTSSTQDAVSVANELEKILSCPIRLIDERYTTTSAHATMKSLGKKQKNTRTFIDQVAAVSILQHGLDMERNLKRPPGMNITEFSG